MSAKGAMHRFVSSVDIITSAHDGRLNGMTATAVCSASARGIALAGDLVGRILAVSMNMLNQRSSTRTGPHAR